MRLYVVVEGTCEKKVYTGWIQFINPTLKYSEDFYKLTENSFAILSGGGYPSYYKIIENAIADVNSLGNVDRLIISIDSEDMTREEKYNEVYNFVTKFECNSKIIIIIQHFCLETWALGNRIILRRNTSNERLKTYMNCFDVITKDPELLPHYPPEDLTRAQFAYKYLRTIISDRYSSIAYSKSRPNIIINNGYFCQLKKRFNETGHISSFESFLTAFI